MIERLAKIHAPEAAQLHILGIESGFISSLGLDFVTALYEAIAESKSSFGFVTCEGEEVIGFVAFTENINSLYKSIIWKKGFKFAFLLGSRLFSWTRLKRIWETLLYPSRVKADDLPAAELLSIAVSPQARGKGIASQLIEAGIAECRKRGMDRMKVLVGANLVAANKLYLKCGFEKAGEIMNHGALSNIYLRRIVS
mgnify:CR=1 FL=1